MDYSQYSTVPAPISHAPTPPSGVIFMFWTFYFIAIALVIAGLWMIFTKAGQKGWKCLIPFYNLYTELLIIKKPGWWLLLFFIPLVNIIMVLVVALNLAKVFGRSGLFGFFFLFLFAPVGYLILGYGSSKYQAGLSSTPSPTTPNQTAPNQNPDAVKVDGPNMDNITTASETTKTPEK